jgi:sigma-54 specific flagellar transcriptional regulator A
MRPNDPRSPADPTQKREARAALLGESPLPVAGPADSWRQWFPEIVGRCESMLKVLETVAKVARSDSSVLVLGESGTGKELIASAIHRLSPRSHKPFIPLNCSAIPENLLESELFGHEKGAFTGADRRRVGHFEAAHEGTIFLDEIGDMPLSLQAKLLRVLQDKKFTPLGGNAFKEVDVRIVAATNTNLDKAVREGKFRTDLFFRLNVLPVQLPALRERADDIPALLEHFVERANRNHRIAEPCYLTDEVMHQLCRFAWPGNVRQVQNLMERLVVMKGGGGITAADIAREIPELIAANLESTVVVPATGIAKPYAPAESYSHTPSAANARMAGTLPRPGQAAPAHVPASFGELPGSGIDLLRFIEDLENDLIRQALERTNNNKNQAAKLLGLNRTTLVERIKKRRLSPLNDPPKEL